MNSFEFAQHVWYSFLELFFEIGISFMNGFLKALHTSQKSCQAKETGLVEALDDLHHHAKRTAESCVCQPRCTGQSADEQVGTWSKLVSELKRIPAIKKWMIELFIARFNNANLAASGLTLKKDCHGFFNLLALSKTSEFNDPEHLSAFLEAPEI